MKRNLRLILSVILLLSVVTLACSLFSGGGEEAAPPPAEEVPGEEAPAAEEALQDKTAPDPEAAPAEDEGEAPSAATPEEIRPAPGVQLGDEFRSEEGGFTFKTIPDYLTEGFMGIVSMEAPDADEELGPYFLLIGGLNEEEMTVDELYKQFETDMENEAVAPEFLEKKEIRVAGHPGLLVDLAGEQDEQDVRGRMVLVAIGPKQQFTMFTSSPADRWEEVEPYFNTVLASVTFHEASAGDLLDFGGDSDSGDSGDSEMGMSTVGAGEFTFMIAAQEGFPTMVEGNSVEYASTADEYIITLVGPEEINKITLYLPINRQELMMQVISFDPATKSKAPSGLALVGDKKYGAIQGFFVFDESPADTITGTFYFDAVNLDDTDEMVMISGEFVALPLQ